MNALAPVATYARSVQTDVAPIHPEARSPHPRAAEMAALMIEIVARDGGVTFAELQTRGFRLSEILEHEPEARRIVRQAIDGDAAPAYDRVPDIAAKAKDAVVNRMPLTASTEATADMRAAWGAYCTSRAAYTLHPWHPLGERCICMLQAFLNLLPLLPAESGRVISDVSAMLRKRRMPH